MEIREMHAIIDNKELNKLDELYTNMNPSHLQDLYKTIEYYAIRLLRISSYLEARQDMVGHNQAVKLSNKTAEKVRRALGYTYPKQDIIW